MEVAIVILNWNGQKLLEEFLPSVVEHSTDAKIYVVDNASTDNSLEFLKHNFTSVETIQLEENKGYAGGYNQSLKQIEEDIVILLNNDVKVTKHWLKPILSTFKQNEDIAVIQPKILDYKNQDFFEYAGAAGGFVDALGYPYCRGRIFSTIEKDNGQYDNDTEIFWASGACFAIRKKIFDDLNGFDESYFAHQEEIDLCWRIFNCGYKVWFCHKSVVFHLGGGTLKSLNPGKTYLNFRNSLFNIIKNIQQPNWFNILFFRLLLDGIACIKFLISGQLLHILAVIKAHWVMFFRFRYYYNSRGDLLNANYYKTSSVLVNYYLRNKKNFSDFN